MMSLGRYLNRMSIRSTPLGTVAGVAVGTFEEGPLPVLDNPAISRARARLDQGWVFRLLKSSKEKLGPHSELKLRTNDFTHSGRGRVWLDTADAYGEGSRRVASVRWSTAVQLVVDSARIPRTFAELEELLTEHYPAIPRDSVVGLLQQLVQLDFLITAHRPSLTSGYEQPHIQAQFEPIVCSSSLGAMRKIEAAVAEFNEHGEVAELPSLFGLIKPLAAEVDGTYSGHFLQVDARLNTVRPPTLPAEIQRLAEDAAEIMTTVSTVFQYPRRLRDYATAFTERYGAHAEVPVLEVLSPETGLGAPAGYIHPPGAFELQSVAPDRGRQAREAVLNRLVATSLTTGGREIALDDQWLHELRQVSQQPSDERDFTPGLDIHLQVMPPSLVEPRWRGVVTETAVAHGGRTFARFYDLIGDDARARLREYAIAEEERLPGVGVVELSYLPAQARAANVSIRLGVRTVELPLNVSPGLAADQVLSLEDIVVGVREGRLYLHSPKLGCDLHVTQNTMLNQQLGPNVCRFLLEVSSGEFRSASPFDWGNLAISMPFLPRIVWREVVLRRARWLLTHRDLPAVSTRAFGDFAEAVAAWRKRWSVPRFTFLTQRDNTLLLDLDSAPSLEDLRHAAGKAKGGFSLQIEEALPAPEESFLRDAHGALYAAEVVVPVLTAAKSADRPACRSKRRRVDESERLRPPGGEWIYAKLYAEPDAMDGLLTGEVLPLANSLVESFGIDLPFYLRYSDPAPHLRVRFQVTGEDRVHEVFGLIAKWAHKLVADGRLTDLVFATYRREIERYGGPYLISQAEGLFKRDSLATLALLRHLSEPVADPGTVALDRVALTSLSLERIGRVLVPDFTERHAFVRTISRPTSGSVEYRAVACDLWRSHTGTSRDARVLEEVTAIWQHEGAQFSAAIDKWAEEGELWSDRQSILRSLLHMHCNRMGLSRDEEEAAYGMWRRLLDRTVGQERTASVRAER
ncbi:hypothetical protein VR41_05320 [Streptomyces sp. NRRL B-1568]|nr:hypothetical protein VR41_05320 [Streptomyces sp. NRRL B-1568]